jgi:hypothetical protein
VPVPSIPVINVRLLAKATLLAPHAPVSCFVMPSGTRALRDLWIVPSTLMRLRSLDFRDQAGQWPQGQAMVLACGQQRLQK